MTYSMSSAIMSAGVLTKIAPNSLDLSFLLRQTFAGIAMP